MIKTISLVVGLGLFMVASKANAFITIPAVSITPWAVQSTVCNQTYPAVIYCRIVSNAQIQNGAWISSFNDVQLFPGACGYAYDTASAPFYFVNGYGSAVCDFFP